MFYDLSILPYLFSILLIDKALEHFIHMQGTSQSICAVLQQLLCH